MGYSLLSLIWLLAPDGATVSRRQALRAISYEATNIIPEARPLPGMAGMAMWNQVRLGGFHNWAVGKLSFVCHNQ